MSSAVIQTFQNSTLPIHTSGSGLCFIRSGSQTQIGYDGDTDSLEGSSEESDGRSPLHSDDIFIPIYTKKAWFDELKTSLSRDSMVKEMREIAEREGI